MKHGQGLSVCVTPPTIHLWSWVECNVLLKNKYQGYTISASAILMSFHYPTFMTILIKIYDYMTSSACQGIFVSATNQHLVMLSLWSSFLFQEIMRVHTSSCLSQPNHQVPLSLDIILISPSCLQLLISSSLTHFWSLPVLPLLTSWYLSTYSYIFPSYNSLLTLFQPFLYLFSNWFTYINASCSLGDWVAPIDHNLCSIQMP